MYIFVWERMLKTEEKCLPREVSAQCYASSSLKKSLDSFIKKTRTVIRNVNIISSLYMSKTLAFEGKRSM